jgi:hypothetical protein
MTIVKSVMTTKFLAHTHPNQSIHIEIDVVLPPGADGVVPVIQKGFEAVMRSISGEDPLTESWYSGEQANAMKDITIDEFFSKKRGDMN